MLSFPVNRALGDESQYYKRRKEDENAFLVARRGEWMLSPFQCETCWFVNLCDRKPVEGSPRDDRTLALLRRVNLDIFWTRASTTVRDMVRLTRRFVQSATESGRKVNLPPFDPWPVGDQVGMEVALQMLEKTLKKGRHGRDYQQFDSVRPLRAAMSDLYSASFSGHEARYSLKSHRGNVLHMYEGPMQSAFMERFVRGLKIRMPAASDRDKPLSGRAVKFVLDRIELEWSDPETPLRRSRELLMAASYICVTYGYSLRGHEAFWVDCDRLVRFIHVGKADSRIPHVIVAALGRFKGEDGDRMHLFPLVNETKSGVRIRVWLERLAALLRAEGKSLCPAFCDDEGYQLSSSHIERVFHPILEELQGREGPLLSGLIPAGIKVRDHYRCSRSFRRGAESEALDNGVDPLVINFVHRWSRFEKSKGKQPGFDMMEHYASGSNTRYMQLSFGEGI